jgi:large subunit ribosomal protein L1
MVRGVVTLPHGTGKDVKVLALVTQIKRKLWLLVDYVGLDDYFKN